MKYKVEFSRHDLLDVGARDFKRHCCCSALRADSSNSMIIETHLIAQMVYECNVMVTRM